MRELFENEPCDFSPQEVDGDRVFLRPLCESDSLRLFQLVDESREFLSEHLPWPDDCRSAGDVAARIESWNMQAQMANGACWGIFEKAADGCVGECSSKARENDSGGFKIAGCVMLGWVQWMHRSATVSYWLGKNFCGRGLATEALILVAGEAFAMGLNRLELTASVYNPKSAAVARRAGFQEEGICREYECLHGRFEDHVRFSLLARDFC